MRARSVLEAVDGRRDVPAPIDEVCAGFPNHPDDRTTVHQNAEFTPSYDLTQGLQPIQQVVEGMSKSEQPTIYIMLKKPSMMV